YVFAEVRINNRTQCFHPTIEIALHQIGAADIDVQTSAVLERVDSGMFEESADNRAHLDVLAHAIDVRPEAADPSDNRVDPDTLERGAVKRSDHPWIGNRVVLQDDPGGTASAGMADLPLDQLREAVAQRDRGDKKGLILSLSGIAGQVVEQVRH